MVGIPFAIQAAGQASVVMLPGSKMFGGAELEVSLRSEPPGQAIWFTTDGTLPTAETGTEYEAPLKLQATTQLRAVAVGTDGAAGLVATSNYIKIAPDLIDYQSHLPILVIENFASGSIPAKGWNGTGAGIQQQPRQAAIWATFDRDSEGQSALNRSPQMLSRIGIRGRGAFSTTWRQKGYSVEAWRDDSDEERKVAPLDFPEHSDWVLYFPDPDQNKDPTLMHNTFMYELSKLAGRYACRFRWMDVFINENGGDLSMADRRGVYALLEKVSRGDDRLDFSQLSEDGSSGGWLLNLNRMDAIPEDGWPAQNGATSPQFFHTPGPNRRSETPANTAGRGDDIPRQSNGFLNFDNPNGYRINEAQRAAIEDWFVQFENVLYDDDLWKDPAVGYRQYLDVDDFVTYFAFHNLSRNGDGLLISMFPWKASYDGRLRMGPAWDYNWSSYDVSGGPTNTRMHRSDRLWYGRLFRDPDFMQAYIDKWFHLRRSVMSNESMEAIIEGQAAEIGDAFGVAQGFRSAAAWQTARSRMINWLQTRADWLDGGYTPPPVFNQQGGHVEAGFQAILSADEHPVYYTIDGSDPRLPGGEISPVARQLGGTVPVSLIGADTPLKVQVPNSATEAEAWRQLDFDDSTWQVGSGGVGFDSPSGGYVEFIDTDVTESMRLTNGSLYIRVPFHVEAAGSVLHLTLGVRYDDGFSAFLNGQPLVAANAPDTLQWDSVATSSHRDDDAVVFQPFEVSASALREGENVLAIQAMNSSASGSDFLCEVQLDGAVATVNAGLSITSSRRIVARALENDDWSAPTTAQFFVGAEVASSENLTLSEIHYHPADPTEEELAPGDPDADNYEFLEFLNKGTAPVDLSNVRIADGVTFDFADAAVQLLEPGARLVVVARAETFQKRYGAAILIAGEYTGSLSNGGERIAILTGDELLQGVTFDDAAPWPTAADGAGSSLQIIAATADTQLPQSWTASSAPNGTPGTGEGSTFPTNPDADNDADGLSALLEYAFGSSDNDPTDGPGAFNVRISPDNLSIDISVTIDPAATELSITLDTSDDLQNWNPSSVTATIEPGKRTWRISASSVPVASFFRLHVTSGN
ncbi:MAG: CotH kinase family protein [Verrucomicrobiales bacterium]